VARLLAAPGLVAAAVLASFGGLGGPASLLILAAIVAGAVRLIEAVGLAVENGGDRLAVVAASAALVCLVAAGATHVVWLAAGIFVCVAVDLLGAPTVTRQAVAEPAELLEAPVSRAA
jgi:hypothetical protein